jgi:hypothetical protein
MVSFGPFLSSMSCCFSLAIKLQCSNMQRAHLFMIPSSFLDYTLLSYPNINSGFIPEETLRQMYPRRPWISAIQVRFVIPHLGFAKGLLVAKQGISKIQVPSSMVSKRDIVVANIVCYLLTRTSFGCIRSNQIIFHPSTQTLKIKILPRMDKAGIALLLVCGVFPSTPNRYFGKFLDDASTEQLPESFEKGIKKLSPMYSHLLEGLGKCRILYLMAVLQISLTETISLSSLWLAFYVFQACLLELSRTTPGPHAN